MFKMLCLAAAFLTGAAITPTERNNYVITGMNSLQKIYYTASTNFSVNHQGDKILDTDPNTGWMSERSAQAQWVQLDFGTKRLMSRITVYPGKKDNYPMMKYCVLQFKSNGDWFDYARIPIEETHRYFSISRISVVRTAYKEKADIDLGGVDASTFRIYVPPDAMVDGQAGIAEVEIYIGSNKLKCYDERLKGLCLPVKNAYLPKDDESYPNAPRRYRGGTHVGLDINFYHTEDSYEPVPVAFTTPVYSIAGGKIIRADLDYRAMTPAEWEKLSEESRNNSRTFVKRSFGGRQVWIDHGNGVVSTYNHLSRIDKSIASGAMVKKGQRIGWAGNSGLLGEAEGKEYGCHLHFEIWMDGTYLGYGFSPENVKKYFSWIFSVAE